MLSNWQAITELYDNGNGQIFQKIRRRLHEIYTQAGWQISDETDFDNQAISHSVLMNKAKVMLKNVVT